MEGSPQLIFEPLQASHFENVTAVCIGTGRFLRAVLVPTVVELGGGVILAQTRGIGFGKYMETRADGTYEADTVLQDGKVVTTCFPVAASGSLGVPQGREAFLKLPSKLPRLRFIGLGLTEAGIVHNGQSIVDLAEFLHVCFDVGKKDPISIINTDNMPFNGDAVRNHVRSCDYAQSLADWDAFDKWLQNHVHFHNTMVDRITSQRSGSPDVPRAEPLPAKALVIEDLAGVLPPQMGSVPGVVVRTQPKQLDIDIALKLRIANGLHTAMVYAMGLGHLFQSDACIGREDVLPYLEQLFERDIAHCCSELSISRLSVTPVFSEWMSRLQHPHFGLGCFFVCQNAIQKTGIRLLPSVKATLAANEVPSDFMVFSFAVILRFLTPVGQQTRLGESPPVFVGRLDAFEGAEARADFEYTTGLSVCPAAGTYEFKDGDGIVPLLLRPLGREGGCSAAAATSITQEVLARLDGFDPRGKPEHGMFACSVAKLLQRMLQGEPALTALASLQPRKPVYLKAEQIKAAVKEEIDACEAVDIHTHLFAAGHSASLMQYGIDAMLTYHYLVSEYLATSEEGPEEFNKLPRSQQAERVWQGLFTNSTPTSEQCRGVLSTLSALGLREEVSARDLPAIRRWYERQDAQMFNDKMMRLARLRYIVTTHDPFEPLETPDCLSPQQQPPRYRSALALDKLIEGDWVSVCRSLSAAGETCSLRGVASLLQRCVDAVAPVFLTTATAHDFKYDAKGTPATYDFDASLEQTADGSSVPPSPQQVLDGVVLPLCHRVGLPLSLRMGTRRGVCKELGLAGDGLGSAQVDSLARLCGTHPKIKFLATVLGRGDQHELTVLASKFRNLHIWGCWWFCNNPTIVSDVTSLRLEMLGTAFTFQASSARVHDQLIYKWIHARMLLVRTLAPKYEDLMETGWQVSRGDIRRDVQRLLGGAFEDFIAKAL